MNLWTFFRRGVATGCEPLDLNRAVVLGISVADDADGRFRLQINSIDLLRKEPMPHQEIDVAD